MKSSETVGKLAEALAKAQAEMGHAKADSLNPHFRSHYASLASCIDAVRGPLSSNGLALVQCAEAEENRAGVTSRLMHSSGEWIESVILLPARKDDAQSMGSALSYARRYALCAIVGLATGDDDDGNAASPQPQRQQAAKPLPKAEHTGHHPSWPDARKGFCAALGEAGWQYETVADWCESLGKARPSYMDGETRAKLLAFIKDAGAEKLLAYDESRKKGRPNGAAWLSDYIKGDDESRNGSDAPA